jgi:hypothetical protein
MSANTEIYISLKKIGNNKVKYVECRTEEWKERKEEMSEEIKLKKKV